MELTAALQSVIPASLSVIPAQAGTHVTLRSIASWNRDKEEDSPVIPAPLLFVIPTPLSVIPAPLHTVIPAQAGTHVTPTLQPTPPGMDIHIIEGIVSSWN